MLSRRDFLKQSAQFGAALALPATTFGKDPATASGVVVNDVQSQLNATRVHEVVRPTSLDAIGAALRKAKDEGRAVSVAGGRHAMGGQQFARDAIHLDMTRFNRVIEFDRKQGLIKVEGGIEWPELIAYLNDKQAGADKQWAIHEKQSGVDKVSLAGSLAANIHGRALALPPIIGDVESFDLLDANGKLHHCSRRENSELFSLAIGGYGLFGIITHVRLRLVPRTKLERVVDIIAVKDLIPKVDERIRDGFLYGDCQYSTDLSMDPETHGGVFSCYRPVAWDTPMPAEKNTLSAEDWMRLYRLARTDRKRAWQEYSSYYRTTTGQVYWSDLHQLAGSFDSYRKAVDPTQGTEVITEVYVSRDNFLPLMAAARQDFIDHKIDITYGTIRFIEADRDSFLRWAPERSVCIICNLHVRHTEEGKQKAAEDFRRIIDRAIEFGGRYYLTYHRWATRRQVETCYPQFVDFLRLKKKYDPQERFQSEWYRHYKSMFADRV
ncbi:MAG: FAD-binding protein [Pirellulales bacterium]